MGQAKLRGTKDSRVAEGILKREAREKAIADKRELERKESAALREAEMLRFEQQKLKRNGASSTRANPALTGMSLSRTRMSLRAGISLASLAVAQAASATD